VATEALCVAYGVRNQAALRFAFLDGRRAESEALIANAISVTRQFQPVDQDDTGVD
jgi:hypothetical protein